MHVFNKLHLFKISEIFTVLLRNIGHLKISEEKQKIIFFNKKIHKSSLL